MEATASAAPAGAGTGSAQGGSPSSQAKAGNSAGNQTSPQRQSGAAPPSSSVDQQGLRDREQRNTAPQNDDDPEFDFGEGRKAKRSQVLSDVRRMRESQAAEARRAADFQKRAEAAEAHREHLRALGIDVEAFAKDPKASMQAYVLAEVKRRVADAQLDPQEREFRQREEQLKTREEQIATQEKQRQEQEHVAQVQARADEWSQHMRQALETSTLPRNQRTVARMADLVIAAARNGQKFPPQELAKRVTESIAEEQKFHASTLKDDPKATAQWIKPYLAHFSGDAGSLADAMGPELVEALRKHILQAHESKFTGTKPQQNQNPARPRPKIFTNPKHPNGYITFEEAQAMGRQRGI